MSSSKPLFSSRRAWRPPVAHQALAVLCVLAACRGDEDPFAQPILGDPGAEGEPASVPDDTAEDPSSVDAGAARTAVQDAGKAVIDARRGGATQDDATTIPAKGNGTVPSTGDGSAPGNSTAAGTRTRDAGVSNPSATTPTDDAAVSFDCAAEFAGCVLENVLAADQCLDAYAECEPGFRTNDAGIDGTCAVHFSACVLGDPLGFDRCFPLLVECEN